VPFSFRQSKAAAAQYSALEAEKTQRALAVLKAVNKALAYLSVDPRYPSLHSHKYSSLVGEKGEEIWESHAQNKTPGAWRIFWHYGPGLDWITVVAITPHP
jgi:hypothetical protein